MQHNPSKLDVTNNPKISHARARIKTLEMQLQTRNTPAERQRLADQIAYQNALIEAQQRGSNLTGTQRAAKATKLRDDIAGLTQKLNRTGGAAGRAMLQKQIAHLQTELDQLEQTTGQ